MFEFNSSWTGLWPGTQHHHWKCATHICNYTWFTVKWVWLKALTVLKCQFATIGKVLKMYKRIHNAVSKVITLYVFKSMSFFLAQLKHVYLFPSKLPDPCCSSFTHWFYQPRDLFCVTILKVLIYKLKSGCVFRCCLSSGCQVSQKKHSVMQRDYMTATIVMQIECW